VAKNFVNAIDDSDFNRADDLIHPDSPLDGAGEAVDIIAAAAGANAVIDALDISVAQTTLLEEGDTQAVVEVTTEISLVIDDVSIDVPMDMRTSDGDWYVWLVNV
jgi:hypothetical protein